MLETVVVFVTIGVGAVVVLIRVVVLGVVVTRVLVSEQVTRVGQRDPAAL